MCLINQASPTFNIFGPRRFPGNILTKLVGKDWTSARTAAKHLIRNVEFLSLTPFRPVEGRDRASLLFLPSILISLFVPLAPLSPSLSLPLVARNKRAAKPFVARQSSVVFPTIVSHPHAPPPALQSIGMKGSTRHFARVVVRARCFWAAMKGAHFSPHFQGKIDFCWSFAKSQNVVGFYVGGKWFFAFESFRNFVRDSTVWVEFSAVKWEKFFTNFYLKIFFEIGLLI